MKHSLEIGSLSGLLRKPALLVVFFLQAVALVVIAADYHGRDTSDGCMYCHADKAKMAASGYPQFYITRAEVERESKMPGVTCRDCHLGDGRSHDADTAHRGMPRMQLIDREAGIVGRKGRLDSVIPTGSDRMYAQIPKVDDGVQRPDPDILTLMWQDRDPVTLAFDKSVAEKTCGRRACHPKETEQFSRTIMGGNVRQRSMRFWTDTHGPNNCGPSFADMPADSGGKDGFSDANYKLIKDELSCPSDYKNATDRQRFCNFCHAGCLDCHYNPGAKSGAHSFTRRIPSVNCNGAGRGTGMCHAGTQERRRGDSYLGAEYSQPSGMPTDRHVEAKMECVDCHETGEKGMGDIQRRVDCAGCHYSITKAHESGVHKKLRCTACHIGKLGGYEMTVWGRGKVSGSISPFKKYSLYYGVMEPPILMKDMEGFYTPYKAWPNMATNFRPDMPKHDRVEFRWPGGETRDAYAFLGTYNTLPGANKALAWIQLEAVGHPLGKSRTCKSCHGSTVQRSNATWEYLNYAGSEPFTGSQEVIADGAGIRIVNIKKTSEPKLIGDANLYDFAAWMYLGDIWNMKGDFSIPKADARKYADYEKAEAAFNGRLSVLQARLSVMDKKSAEFQSLEKKTKKARGIGEHEPEMGLRELNPPLPPHARDARVSPSMPLLSLSPDPSCVSSLCRTAWRGSSPSEAGCPTSLGLFPGVR